MTNTCIELRRIHKFTMHKSFTTMMLRSPHAIRYIDRRSHGLHKRQLRLFSIATRVVQSTESAEGSFVGPKTATLHVYKNNDSPLLWSVGHRTNTWAAPEAAAIDGPWPNKSTLHVKPQLSKRSAGEPARFVLHKRGAALVLFLGTQESLHQATGPCQALVVMPSGHHCRVVHV